MPSDLPARTLDAALHLTLCTSFLLLTWGALVVQAVVRGE